MIKQTMLARMVLALLLLLVIKQSVSSANALETPTHFPRRLARLVWGSQMRLAHQDRRFLGPNAAAKNLVPVRATRSPEHQAVRVPETGAQDDQGHSVVDESAAFDRNEAARQKLLQIHEATYPSVQVDINNPNELKRTICQLIKDINWSMFVETYSVKQGKLKDETWLDKLRPGLEAEDICA